MSEVDARRLAEEANSLFARRGEEILTLRRQLREAEARHELRVAELLAANNAEVERRRAAEERLRWQPIETAPRDGTLFDVWLGDADTDDVAFYCTPGTRFGPGWHWLNGKFRPALGFGLQAPTLVQPTHWRPLPETPHD